MAEIYPRVRGKKLNKFIAEMDGTGDGVEHHAKKLARRAAALLETAPKERTGASHIEVGREKRKQDRHVALVDEKNGHWGAMSIEKGRDAYYVEGSSGRSNRRSGTGGRMRKVGSMEGLHILGNAVKGASL